MSDSAFAKAIEFILPHETEFRRGHFGDYDFAAKEDVAGDSGGLTKFGIDQSAHPHVDIAALDKAAAVEIYHDEWRAHGLDALPDKLAIAAFDVWVNGGHASQWLQRAYNITHPDAPQLAEDGRLGPVSLAALAASDQDAIVREFIRQRNARFRALAQSPSRAKFLAGWLQRDSDLAALLATC